MLIEKTAIVTGAASGIGYAVARALRQEGAQVVMACSLSLPASWAAYPLWGT